MLDGESLRLQQEAFTRVAARFPDLVPQSYEAAKIPRSHCDGWDRVYATFPIVQRVVQAREWESLNLSPAEAEPWVRAGIDFDTAIVSCAVGATLDATLRWRARGWTDPTAIALLELNGGRIETATFTDYPRRFTALHSKTWPGIWRVFDDSHVETSRFVRTMRAALSIKCKRTETH